MVDGVRVLSVVVLLGAVMLAIRRWGRASRQAPSSRWATLRLPIPPASARAAAEAGDDLFLIVRFGQHRVLLTGSQPPPTG